MIPVRVEASRASRTGVWVGIAAITMTFTAFTSAFVVRQGSGTDWIHFRIPALLYVNTLILLASSGALELARPRMTRAAALGDAPAQGASTWVAVTLGLGLLFVCGQVLAWRNLVAQGLVLATGPSNAFFYVFTVVHALHVLGGIAGLIYLLRRLGQVPASLAEPVYGATALYWHFMAVLWLYLLLLLTVRL
ncbi:MAG TPA: cytochrome c oxidase subunit 3 [Gemmatimonadales bacterium]|nr:cytochrome c oxidase subunit 3 [Gemmatimonadales bacterium]